MTALHRGEPRHSLVIAGHTGFGKELRESEDDKDETEIGAPWIAAAVVLAVGTIALLVWLSSASTKAKLRRAAPGVVLAVAMAAPLIYWTATANDAEGGEVLTAERATSATGAPELIVSLEDDELNTSKLTNGKTTVGLKCFGREGQVVLDGRQRWPFVDEPGFDNPHAHQRASADQLRRAHRCRLQGTSVRLEADVEGAPAP